MAASSRPAVKLSTGVKAFEPAAELESEVMDTFPTAVSTLFSTTALVLELITLVDTAPAPLTEMPALPDTAADKDAATATV